MELEANLGSPKQGRCRDLAVKCLFVVGGTLWFNLQVKLKSVNIWRMKDSAVCPFPASLPPNPVLPTQKFSPPMLPHELSPGLGCLPWGMVPLEGGRGMLWHHTAKPCQRQPHTTAQAPFLRCPRHPHRLLALKGLPNRMMTEKGLQDAINLRPLLINYWSDI